MTVRCSNILLDRYREDLEVYSGCSMCMQRKHLKSNMTYPPRLPGGWRCCPCSHQCPAELVGSSMCNPQGCGAGWHLTKHRNMQDQNEGLRGACNTHKAAGLRLALSKLRIRPWGHAREDHLSSKKCFRCRPLGFECSRPPEGRMPRQIADFYHSIYVQIFTMLFRVCSLT